MKVIKSTGNAEQDAKLVAEALGQSNAESFEKAKERAAKSNTGEHFGNALVAEPHLAGETLLVIREPEDGIPNKETDDEVRATLAAKVQQEKVKTIQPVTEEASPTRSE